jgi:hypothetical protein
MPDPSNIRRRREEAEWDEAQFLLDELERGASIVTDDAAARTQRSRESARLRGENVDGSVIPSIGLSPELPSVIPSGYEDSTDRTFLEMGGAEDIADERARDLESERLALREMRRETGEETTERLRREWGERGLLGRSLDREMPPVTIPGTDIEYSPAAGLGGMLDTLTFGHADELMAAADQARYGGEYETHRRRRDEEARDVRERFPYSYGAGLASQLPAMLATSVGTAGLAPTAARSILLGEAAATGGLAAHGASAAPLDARGQDVRRGAALGGALGLAGQAAGDVVEAARPGMQRMADSLDEWAAPLRVRGSVGTGLEAMRRIDDLPGGIDRFAQDLDQFGISPRGSVHSVDTAQQRAVGVRGASSGTLDDVFNRMELEERADDVVAQWLQPRGARPPRDVPPTLPGGRRASPDAGTLPPTRAPGLAAETAPPTYREPASTAVAPPPVAARGRVNLEPVAGILDDVAERNARLPGQGPVVEGARELAGQYREHGGMRTFREAQDLVETLDQPANWTANTSPVGSRLPAVASRARDLRRGVRDAMDAAVDSVDPSLGESYRAARRQNQVGRIVEGRGRDMALREANNRQVSPSDYIAGLSGFTEGGFMEGARNVLFNRLLRGREATMGAAGAERMADLLRSRAARSVSPGALRPIAARAAGAASAEDPAQLDAAPLAADAAMDFESLPVIETPAGVEEIDLDNLPVIETAPDIEEVEF